MDCIVCFETPEHFLNLQCCGNKKSICTKCSQMLDRCPICRQQFVVLANFKFAKDPSYELAKNIMESIGITKEVVELLKYSVDNRRNWSAAFFLGLIEFQRGNPTTALQLFEKGSNECYKCSEAVYLITNDPKHKFRSTLNKIEFIKNMGIKPIEVVLNHKICSRGFADCFFMPASS